MITNATYLTKNPIRYYRTKYINIRYHLIRDYIDNHNIFLYFIDTKHQLIDIFTKPLSEIQFDFIKRELSILNLLNS